MNVIKSSYAAKRPPINIEYEIEKYSEPIKKFSRYCGGKLLSGEKNSFISPLSMYMAFGMLASGADEKDNKKSLLKFLNSDNSESIENCCSELLGNAAANEILSRRHNDGQFRGASITNSAWLSDKFSINQDYIDIINTKYHGDVMVVDYWNPACSGVIEDWIAKSTRDMVRPSLDLDEDTLITLINIIYFHGTWDDEFDPTETKVEDFLLTSGEKIDTPLMQNRFDDYYAKLEICKAIDLSLNDRHAMRIVLPEEQETIESILSDADKYERALESPCDRFADITIKLPRFDYDYKLDLKDYIKQLGIVDAVKSKDYKKISPDFEGISGMIHSAKIKLDEQGVEAAAATVIAGFGAGLPIPPPEQIDLFFNKPFLFGIKDRNTDTWLFLGTYVDPRQ